MLESRRGDHRRVMDWGCEILPTFWCRTLMIPQRTILIFNISIKRKSNAQTATQTRKLHMKHCLFRDLVVSKFASNLICQRHIPPTEPFHDVCNRNMYCYRNSECTKLHFFSREIHLHRHGRRLPTVVSGHPVPSTSS